MSSNASLIIFRYILILAMFTEPSFFLLATNSQESSLDDPFIF